MPANTTFVSGAILTAAQMNNLPWGIVDATAGGTSNRGWVQSTSGFGVPTTTTDVTSMTVTFTPVTGRLYRARYVTRIDNQSTAQLFTAEIANGSNIVLQYREVNVAASQSQLMSIEVILTGLSGSTTLKARGKAGTIANGFFNAGATSPMQFMVEDIGPST